MRVWRVGHSTHPLGFPPIESRSWRNRFDDERHAFRTLYAASNARTALWEVFQDYAPDTTAQLGRGELYPSPYLAPSEDLYPGQERIIVVLGPSRWAHLSLAEGDVALDHGELIDLVERRGWIARRFADLLACHGIERLEITELTRRDERRPFTQALARLLFDAGFAGVTYPSNMNVGQGVALFEGRAHLELVGNAEAVNPSMTEMAGFYDQLQIVLTDLEADDNADRYRGHDPFS